VTDIRIILDTSATLAYAAGSLDVGEVIAEVADEDARFAVPLLCLVEAARQTSAEHLPSLYLLGSHQHGLILAELPKRWRSLAGVARVLGRADLAAALLAAQELQAYVLTAEPDSYGDPGRDLVIAI
jgi:hypothetical protein